MELEAEAAKAAPHMGCEVRSEGGGGGGLLPVGGVEGGGRGYMGLLACVCICVCVRVCVCVHIFRVLCLAICWLAQTR